MANLARRYGFGGQTGEQRFLEKRRAMLNEEVASLRRVGSFMEPTDKEMAGSG